MNTKIRLLMFIVSLALFFWSVHLCFMVDKVPASVFFFVWAFINLETYSLRNKHG